MARRGASATIRETLGLARIGVTTPRKGGPRFWRRSAVVGRGRAVRQFASALALRERGEGGYNTGGYLER